MINSFYIISIKLLENNIKRDVIYVYFYDNLRFNVVFVWMRLKEESNSFEFSADWKARITHNKPSLSQHKIFTQNYRHKKGINLLKLFFNWKTTKENTFFSIFNDFVRNLVFI
jgi:hypothetical protein